MTSPQDGEAPAALAAAPRGWAATPPQVAYSVLVVPRVTARSPAPEEAVEDAPAATTAPPAHADPRTTDDDLAPAEPARSHALPADPPTTGPVPTDPVPTDPPTTDPGPPDAGLSERARAVTDPGPLRPVVVGPLVSVLRRPFTSLLPLLLVLGLALGAARSAPPTWSATAQLLVGRADVEANAVPGFVSATQQLAATYARLVASTVVVDRVAGSLGLPPDEVMGRIRADPIPESSLIDVVATSSSEAEAVALAGAAATELTEYLSETTASPARAQELLAAYGAAAQELRVAQAALEAAEAAASAAGDEDGALAVAAAEARGRVDQATLQAQTTSSAYTDSQRGAADRGALQIVSAATSTGDDQRSRLQLAGLAGLAVGGLLGVGLACLLENRQALGQLRRRGRGRR